MPEPSPNPAVEQPVLASTVSMPSVAPTAAPAGAAGQAATLPASPALAAVSVPGYELLGELGRGGMGVVYQARHLALRRLVALKMILHGGLAPAADLERFRSEAQVIARLQHAHIVQIYEVGQRDGLPFLALEYCAGGGLDKKLAGSPLAPPAAAALVEQLAQAVQAAHTRGVIHRDLKPANVLLAEDGTPKITDFGLAKQLDETGRTRTGAILGTPSYMAPEQAGGKARELGPACDIYALGAILYECLTGRPPFRAATPLDTLWQVVHEEPVPPTRLNARLPRDAETICLKCLHKDPARRYTTAQALAEDLRRFQDGKPIAARPASPLEKAVKWAKRKPAQAVAVLVSVLAGTVLLAGGLWFTGELRQERDNAQNEREETRKARDAESERAGQLAGALIDVQAARTAEKERAQEVKQERDSTRAALKDAQRLLANNHIVLAENAWHHNGTAAIANDYLDLVPPDLRNWEWRYLRGIYHGGLFALYGPKWGVAVSGDGSRIVTTGMPTTVWDGRTGRALFHLPTGRHGATCVAISSDAGRIVTGVGRQLQVWDGRTGQLLFALDGHTDVVTCVALSGDDGRIVSGGRDRSVRLWDARTGKALHHFEGHTREVMSVALSYDGSRLVSCCQPGDMRVWAWDGQAGKPLPIDFRGLRDHVMAVALSADAQRIAGGLSTGSVCVWESNTGRLLHQMEHLVGADVDCVAFSGDGSRVVSGGVDATVRVWNSFTGQAEFALKGHTSYVNHLAVSQDGSRIVSSSADKTVRVWDGRPRPPALPLQGHPGYVSCVAVSGDGSRVVTGCSDTAVRLWDGRTGQIRHVFKGDFGGVKAVALSRDGSRCAAVTWNDLVRVWDTGNGKALFQLKEREVSGIALGGDGSRLIVANSDAGTVSVWDVRKQKVALKLEGTVRGVSSVAQSGDDRRIVGGIQSKGIRVWDASTGKMLLEWAGSASRVAINDDGTRIVSCGGTPANTVHVWDGNTGKLLHELKGHSIWVRCVALSPDGTRVVSGSMDKTMRLWDAGTGLALVELKGHQADVMSVAWSADGETIVSGSLDNTAFVWRPERPHRELAGPTDTMRDAAFSHDGSRVVGLASDQSVQVWDAPSGQLRLHIPAVKGTSLLRVAFGGDGTSIVATGFKGETIAWDARTGTRWPDEARPPAAQPRDTTPDGQFRLVIAGKRVLVVPTQLEESEWLRRRWLTLPDPEWHAEQRERFAMANNAIAAACHAFWEQKARGLLAFEAGDFLAAITHFDAAAALKPKAPAPPNK
jgi:WD40 repeat protein